MGRGSAPGGAPRRPRRPTRRASSPGPCRDSFERPAFRSLGGSRRWSRGGPRRPVPPAPRSGPRLFSHPTCAQTPPFERISHRALECRPPYWQARCHSPVQFSSKILPHGYLNRQLASLFPHPQKRNPSVTWCYFRNYGPKTDCPFFATVAKNGLSVFGRFGEKRTVHFSPHFAASRKLRTRGSWDFRSAISTS